MFITNPASEFELSPDEFLQVLKPIYELADSGYIWHKTLDEHLKNELEMIPTIIDP